MKLGKAQQRDYDAVMVGLNYDSASGLNLDTRNFGHSAGTGYLLADNHFKMGARNRKLILENLKDGKPIENLDTRLKGVLWGGIIGRHLQGNGDASQFCMSFESPVQRAEMESKMMSTKAAKDLMAADSKKLMGILGSRTKFNKMLDDVITQMTKVKTTTRTSSQPNKTLEASSANLFK